MNTKKYAMAFFIFIIIFSLFFTYAHMCKTKDFRIVLENRTSIYLRVNEENIIDTGRKNEIKNLMYCENIIYESNGVKCGFYINGNKFSIGN